MSSESVYQVGETIDGRYLVCQVLRGGMGEVYLCADVKDYSPLALKTIQTGHWWCSATLSCAVRGMESQVSEGREEF